MSNQPDRQPVYGWVETRRTYRRKTIFGNRRTQTVVSRPSQRNANRRTRQHFGVTITEEWRLLGTAPAPAQRTARDESARARRYGNLAVIFAVLTVAGIIGINNAAPRSALSVTMGWVIGLSVVAGVVSMVRFAVARHRAGGPE